MIDPSKPSIGDSASDTLAELRRHAELCPEAIFTETADLACLLRRPEAEVEAALQWLIDDGLELRA